MGGKVAKGGEDEIERIEYSIGGEKRDWEHFLGGGFFQGEVLMQYGGTKARHPNGEDEWVSICTGS